MKIMGHRGCKGEEPENTLLGLKSAIDKGVKAMEFDVHRTSDGQLVVIHDDTVDRTTNGSGKVLEMSLEGLQKLDAGKGEKIPTLEQVLTLMKENPMDTFIEIKAQNCEQGTIDLIHKLDILDMATIISFDHRILREVKRIDPSINVTPLMYGLPLDPIAIIETVDGTGISLNTAMIDKEVVDKVHAKGLKVTTWNANTKEDYLKFKEMGVDFIGSDYPERIQS